MLKFKNRVAVYHYGKKVIDSLGFIHVLSSENTIKTTTYISKEDYTKYMDTLIEQGLIKNSYEVDMTKGLIWID